jgi:DNA mismatch repair protein MutS
VGVPKISHAEGKTASYQPQQLGLFGDTAHPVIKHLEKVEPDDLSPRQAMDALYDLKRLLRKSL